MLLSPILSSELWPNTIWNANHVLCAECDVNLFFLQLVMENQSDKIAHDIFSARVHLHSVDSFSLNRDITIALHRGLTVTHTRTGVFFTAQFGALCKKITFLLFSSSRADPMRTPQEYIAQYLTINSPQQRRMALAWTVKEWLPSVYSHWVLSTQWEYLMSVLCRICFAQATFSVRVIRRRRGQGKEKDVDYGPFLILIQRGRTLS